MALNEKFFPVTDYHATPYDWEQARVNEAPFGSGDDYLSHMLNHGAGMAEDLCPTAAGRPAESLGPKSPLCPFDAKTALSLLATGKSKKI